MSEFTIRPLGREDREWVAHFLDEHWGTTQVVSRGKALYGHLLEGFVAERGDDDENEETEAKDDGEDAEEKPKQLGLVTYHIENEECEITTIDSVDEQKGVGTALVDAVKEMAKEQGCKRIWLITTNDNLEALKFWQKRDYELVMVHRGAIAQARRIKPQIPIVGMHGIPIRDEIELEYQL